MSAPEGRFEGDLFAELEHSATERRPYRVNVWVWDWYYDYAEKKESLKWVRSEKHFNVWDGQKTFRSFEKAVDYLVTVRADAERRRIRREVSEKRAAGWEVIA